MSTPQLEVREFEVRLAEPDSDKREFTGIAVPWDTVANIAGLYEERIARGAVVDSEDAKVWWRHAEPIGRITRTEDTQDGWQITGVLSCTPRGDEAYTLLRDGVVDRLSIGFTPIEHTDETHDDGSITRTRTKIQVREVSIVPLPAYSGAAVTQVREARTEGDEPMSDTLTRADLDEVRTSMEEMERELKLAISETTTPEESGELFRSFGDYVKALAAGDETAKRAFEGAVSGDGVTKDAWVGEVIRLGAERQRITRLFQHTKDLPAEGNNVEYAKLDTENVKVEEQENEGDDLAYGKVAITTETAKVRTLGGWTSLSRQAIERTTVSVLDTTFRLMYLRYAQAIERLTRGAVTTAFNETVAARRLDSIEADLTTQDGVVAALVDLVEHFEDNAVSLSGLLVSKDAFMGLLAVPATDRILQVAQAPTDRLGTLVVSSLTGNIAGVPVTLWPGAPTGAVLAYDETAVRTQESPGAPWRLQDDNIVNLTKSFSVYGYAASYAQVPDGLVKVTPAA